MNELLICDHFETQIVNRPVIHFGVSEPATLERQGCQLSYRVEGDGPPVLFIQGVGVHGDGWLPQVQGLSARYRCLTFDNRGMGRSQPVTGPLSVEQMAEDALALMDAQGW